MTQQEKIDIQGAITIYLSFGELPRCPKHFCSRIPNVTPSRLKVLITRNGTEIAAMAGKTKVSWNSGWYRKSGNGQFGRLGCGDRAKQIQPSISWE